MSHHEKWDGSGYPKGLSGENIPLLGRICAVTDVYDALTSKRPYKEAFSNEKSLEIMKEGSGKHFDPNLISIFFNNLDEVFAIQKKFKTGVPLKENERFSPEYPELLRQIISETKTIR